jgi:hypothetical protein
LVNYVIIIVVQLCHLNLFSSLFLLHIIINSLFIIITIYSTPCHLRECIISFHYLLFAVVIYKPLFGLIWHIIILIVCYLSKAIFSFEELMYSFVKTQIFVEVLSMQIISSCGDLFHHIQELQALTISWFWTFIYQFYFISVCVL